MRWVNKCVWSGVGEGRFRICDVWEVVSVYTLGNFGVFKRGGDPFYRQRRKIYQFTYWGDMPIMATLGAVVGNMKLRPSSS